jgi:hypothetical protein
MGLLVLRVIKPCGFHLANLGLVICQEHGTRVSPRPKIARWLACLSDCARDAGPLLRFGFGPLIGEVQLQAPGLGCYGDLDPCIPVDKVETLRNALPTVDRPTTAA